MQNMAVITSPSTANHGDEIPLMRPWLPKTAQLIPYLERIDSVRWYTNNGPLVREFEDRLASHFGARDESIVCVCNGAIGLLLMLMNLNARSGSLCLMPAWTFAACPASAVAAGFVPFFMDVSEETWSLDPGHVRENLSRIPGPIGAIMAVSPFGAPLMLDAWRMFEQETGIPVVLDMAAAFDSFRIGQTPAMVSMDATKIFGIGEGAFVATTDEYFAERIRRSSNYGFARERCSESVGINGKMSEYAAAVGLARFNAWEPHRLAYQQLTELYLDIGNLVAGVACQPEFGNGWYTSFLNIRLPCARADFVVSRLQERRIGARKWWGDGCHRQPAFADCPRLELPITEALAASVLGLPFYPGLEAEAVEIVCTSLREILDGCRFS